MLCEKCGGSVLSNMKCSVCGADNSKTDYSPITDIKPAKSLQLDIFMGLVIFFNSMMGLFLLLMLLFWSRNSLITVILSASIFICALEVFTGFFIIKRKKWALFTYLALSVFGGLLLLITGNFLSILINAVLLFIIFKKDWEYFE